MTRPKYLLDTNVVSELSRKQPSKRVLGFIEDTESQALHISVLTLGELQKGVAVKRSSDPAGALQLATWIDAVKGRFTNRIFDLDLPTATIWGELSAGRSRPVVDTLLAASALAHGMILVTRNTRDVADTGVQILNPWT